MSKTFDLPTLSGAERLFVTIFPDAKLSDIPSDIEDTMEQVMSALTDRARNIMHMYYWEGLTVPEISENYSISQDKVQSIISRSLTRFKNKAHASYIRHGEKYYQAERYRRLQDEISFETHELAKLEQALADIRKRKDEIKEQICRELEIKQYDEVSALLDSDNTPISDLGLSVRSCNTLIHNGLHTVGELRKFCREKGMYHIRGMGKMGAEEVFDAVLKKTGIELQSSKN